MVVQFIIVVLVASTFSIIYEQNIDLGNTTTNLIFFTTIQLGRLSMNGEIHASLWPLPYGHAKPALLYIPDFIHDYIKTLFIYICLSKFKRTSFWFSWVTFFLCESANRKSQIRIIRKEPNFFQYLFNLLKQLYNFLPKQADLHCLKFHC